MDGREQCLPGLFDDEEGESKLVFAPGATLLRNLVGDRDRQLLDCIDRISAQAPFRQMTTPGGRRMSVEMTNCGQYGWVTDKQGYRYTPRDPSNLSPWPTMPTCFRDLAARAALKAGFESFQPDSCLINRYHPGARLGLHQDQDEADFTAPIVSFSLGLPAVFLFGGRKRAGKLMHIPLMHGDVLVWGGPSRLNHHGIQPLKQGTHPLLGSIRINLTFRKAR